MAAKSTCGEAAAVPLMSRQRNDEYLMHRNKPLKDISVSTIALEAGGLTRRGDLIIPFISIHKSHWRKEEDDELMEFSHGESSKSGGIIS
jgi:hypothetical protein